MTGIVKSSEPHDEVLVRTLRKQDWGILAPIVKSTMYGGLLAK